MQAVERLSCVMPPLQKISVAPRNLSHNLKRSATDSDKSSSCGAPTRTDFQIYNTQQRISVAAHGETFLLGRHRLDLEAIYRSQYWLLMIPRERPTDDTCPLHPVS